MDSLIPFACRDRMEGTGIPGAVPKEAPEPLLANYGAVNSLAYQADIIVSHDSLLLAHDIENIIEQMYTAANAQERTIHHMDQLLRDGGWKITAVHRLDGDSTFAQPIEAVPI